MSMLDWFGIAVGSLSIAVGCYDWVCGRNAWSVLLILLGLLNICMGGARWGKPRY